MQRNKQNDNVYLEGNKLCQNLSSVFYCFPLVQKQSEAKLHSCDNKPRVIHKRIKMTKRQKSPLTSG